MTEVRNTFDSTLGDSHADFAVPDFTDIAENGLYVLMLFTFRNLRKFRDFKIVHYYFILENFITV